jgi:hypothetical protein
MREGPAVANKKAGGDKPEKETIAGYFRRIFGENPRLLKERSNDALLARWRQDHPGEKVNASVKAGLSNIKSILRSQGRKKKARKEAADQRERDVQAGIEPRKAAPPKRGMAALEEAIDDCLMMAKATDKEGLEVVIDLLRRARNQVVWKMGEPA